MLKASAQPGLLNKSLLWLHWYLKTDIQQGGVKKDIHKPHDCPVKPNECLSFCCGVKAIIESSFSDVKKAISIGTRFELGDEYY